MKRALWLPGTVLTGPVSSGQICFAVRARISGSPFLGFHQRPISQAAARLGGLPDFRAGILDRPAAVLVLERAS